MDIKKISKIVEKAKKTYVDSPKSFTPYLENRNQILPFNYVVGRNVNSQNQNIGQNNLNSNKTISQTSTVSSNGNFETNSKFGSKENYMYDTIPFSVTVKSSSWSW